MVWCIGDPPVLGIRFDSHIGNGEHYTAIRTNPQYRIECAIMELESRLEPAHYQLPDAIELTGKPPRLVYHGRMRDLKDELDQVRLQGLHIQKELNLHIQGKVKDESPF